MPMTASRRKLTVLDAMILVATAAAGFAAARAYYYDAWDSSSISRLKMTISAKQTLISAMSALQEFRGVTVVQNSPSVATIQREIAAYERRVVLEKFFATYHVFLSFWTFALVLLDLRNPRPRLRRLAHEAGWAACLAAVVVVVVRTVSAIVSWGAEPVRATATLWPSFVHVFDDLASYTGTAIVAVWVVIAMSGRCRLDWSSIGWLTLITAVAWVMLAFQGAAIAVLAPT
jgi:hypothetical protein